MKISLFLVATLFFAPAVTQAEINVRVTAGGGAVGCSNRDNPIDFGAWMEDALAICEVERKGEKIFRVENNSTTTRVNISIGGLGFGFCESEFPNTTDLLPRTFTTFKVSVERFWVGAWESTIAISIQSFDGNESEVCLIPIRVLIDADCDQNKIADKQEIANKPSLDCNKDGKLDKCQADSDGDGAIDACDGCPVNPNKIAPGICGCDNSDTDRDGDGILDCRDACPDQPGPSANGGCPIAEDCDKNGVPDNQEIANNRDLDCNKDGKLDKCQADSDDDGVIDACDKCPNQPGLSENAGCPCDAQVFGYVTITDRKGSLKYGGPQTPGRLYRTTNVTRAVRLTDPTSGAESFAVIEGPEGFFLFDGLKPATYRIQAFSFSDGNSPVDDGRFFSPPLQVTLGCGETMPLKSDLLLQAKQFPRLGLPWTGAISFTGADFLRALDVITVIAIVTGQFEILGGHALAKILAESIMASLALQISTEISLPDFGESGLELSWTANDTWDPVSGDPQLEFDAAGDWITPHGSRHVERSTDDGLIIRVHSPVSVVIEDVDRGLKVGYDAITDRSYSQLPSVYYAPQGKDEPLEVWVSREAFSYHFNIFLFGVGNGMYTFEVEFVGTKIGPITLQNPTQIGQIDRYRLVRPDTVQEYPKLFKNDCNNNFIPDDTELNFDCDNNHEPDSCEFQLTTVFVDAANKGCANGTANFPFRTVASGNDAIMPGNKLIISAGEYREAIRISKPIRIEARNGLVRIAPPTP